MSVFVVCVCFVNILLWIIFLVRFKKIFSTDSIIEKTRDQMNRLIADIDKATERDMFLSGEASKRIQKLLDEEDKKLEMFNEASSRLRDMIAEADKINKMSNQKSTLFQDFNKIQPVKKNNYNKVNAYLENARKASESKKAESLDPETTFEPVKSGQGDLFDQEKKETIIKPEINVTPDGAAYKEVPLIITDIYQDQKEEHEPGMPVIEYSVEAGNRKKSLAKQVQQLYNQGLESEEIASRLSCSITEVDLILAML